MTRLLFVDYEKCVGCMACVLACSLQHGNTIGPANSMILPVSLKRQVVNLPIVCRQCAKPLCADACPMGAISRNTETGAIIVDSELCIGCGACIIACPLGGISMNPEAGHAVKCDLCGGEPLCVQFCGYDAIDYITEQEATIRSKKRALRHFLDLFSIPESNNKED